MTRQMVWLAATLGTLSFAASVSHTLVEGQPNSEGNVFRWSRQVDVANATSDELLAITLDRPIFAATQPGMADLRLRTDKGEAVAYVIRRAQGTTKEDVHRSWAAVQRGGKPLDGGGLEILLESPRDAPQPQGLRIVTPLRDFEHRVQVFSSADGRDWQPAGPPGAIFDYSQFVDVRNSALPVNAGEHRHFRLVIDDITAEQTSQLMELTRQLRDSDEVERSERTMILRRPFRVDRVEFFRDDVESRPSGPRSTQYAPRDVKVTIDAKARQTVIDFATDREPLTSVTLETDATNFSRAATVQIPPKPSASTRWTTIGSGTLARFSFEVARRNSVSIHFAEQRGDRYRLVIDNRDSPPLEVSGVSIAGPVYQIVFLKPKSGALWLDYGAHVDRAASYDTAAIETLLAANRASTEISLGEPRENEVETATASARSLLENRAVLIGGIAALTAILAWALFQASRRLQGLPPQ